MSSDQPVSSAKTLQLRQTWFLAVMAISVVCMFAFVILPYVDRSAQVGSAPAVDFDVPLLSGGKPGDRVRLSDLKGKTVVLDFWASWCAPCRQQTAALISALPRLDSDVYVLGIATSDQRGDAEQHISGLRPPFANAFDEGNRVARAYQVTSLPTLIVIDPEGHVRVVRSQVLDADQLVELLETIKG